ncbi:hypothetical protein [Candidatus Mycoplasma mahonii]|nr:hypothetical protein [Candidatus Mycoplasma mahonii]WKX02374.1 hypothetical protein O3I44_03185 [Candidatus Mycoplasma mahonii]WKX02377.1 hypothetical protein O3I44_03200 [Candidatus Mycoplasma mahonii]
MNNIVLGKNNDLKIWTKKDIIKVRPITNQLFKNDFVSQNKAYIAM